MPNNMPPSKKRENNSENSKTRKFLSEDEIMNLPLRRVKTGNNEYLGYYDKDNLVIYFTDDDGKLTGQTGTLKKPLAEYTDGVVNNNRSKDASSASQDSNNSDDGEQESTDETDYEEDTEKESSQRKENNKKNNAALSKDVKKPKRRADDTEKRTGKGKIIAVLCLICVVALGAGGLWFYQNRTLKKGADEPVIEHIEGQMVVIEIKNDVLPGDVITEDNIQAASIDNQTYNQIAVNGNDLYKWEQKKNIVGMYASEYISAGKYITTNSVTKIYKNNESPWENHNELLKYVDIPLQENQFNFDELRIGDKIDLFFEVSRKEDTNTETLESAQTGVSVLSENSVVTTMSYNIQGLTVVNLITDDNKTLFDTYSSLMKIPEANQEIYFKNTIKSNDSFIKSLTPTSVRVVLDNIYADAMATAITSKSDIRVSKKDDTDTAENAKKNFYDNQTIMFDNINAALKSLDGEE